MNVPIKNVEFQCTEIHSHVSSEVFGYFYVSHHTVPRTVTVSDVTAETHKLAFDTKPDTPKPDTLGLVMMLFCHRENKEGVMVTHPLGSATLDLSKGCKTYNFAIHDNTVHPPLHTGQISVNILSIPANLSPICVQTTDFAHLTFSEAEHNLSYIQGFATHGLPPIEEGLKMVHSPYYTTHMGTVLPSGVFCMIPTDEYGLERGLIAYREKLKVALDRNGMTQKHFKASVREMMSGGTKHRCINVIGDVLTMHGRINTHYTADVQYFNDGAGQTCKSTERWEIPREPIFRPAAARSSRGEALVDGQCYTGDCEDFARDVYQQVKELCSWVLPSTSGTALQALSAVLHMYVPTIEQGAVDSSAHTEYITYWAPFRNHIWAALHPRHAFLAKCSPPMDVRYERWAQQSCESQLPMIHLEGTGDVMYTVSDTTPAYVKDMVSKKREVLNQEAWLSNLASTDMSLQTAHSSRFYKYPIACMTDVFEKEGVLDFTYVTDKLGVEKYGVSIYDWARGRYAFRPSTTHDAVAMADFRRSIAFERPIFPISASSETCQRATMEPGADYVRFGQRWPFESVPSGAITAEYKLGETPWHEMYFKVEPSLC